MTVGRGAIDTVPTTMSAAVYQGPMACTVEEVPVPAVGPDEVLIEVSHCGICGSDLHLFDSGWGTPGVDRGPRVQRHGRGRR